MLKPALLYTREITRKFTEHLYTTDYFYYCGYPCGNNLPKIEEKDDLYQYAIVDKNDDVIGFLTYRINDFSDTVQDFGLFSFDKGNPNFQLKIKRDRIHNSRIMYSINP